MEKLETSFLDLKKYSVLHIFHSLNEPQISPGSGQSVQLAKAYVLALQKHIDRGIEVFVALFFIESAERVLYKLAPFPVEHLVEKLLEGQTFLEQMGFLMDNANFGALSTDEKNKLVRAVPALYEDVDLYLQSLTTTQIKYRNPKADAASQDASVDNESLFLEQYVRVMSML